MQFLQSLGLFSSIFEMKFTFNARILVSAHGWFLFVMVSHSSMYWQGYVAMETGSLVVFIVDAII